MGLIRQHLLDKLNKLVRSLGALAILAFRQGPLRPLFVLRGSLEAQLEHIQVSIQVHAGRQTDRQTDSCVLLGEGLINHLGSRAQVFGPPVSPLHVRLPSSACLYRIVPIPWRREPTSGVSACKDAVGSSRALSEWRILHAQGPRPASPPLKVNAHGPPAKPVQPEIAVSHFAVGDEGRADFTTNPVPRTRCSPFIGKSKDKFRIRGVIQKQACTRFKKRACCWQGGGRLGIMAKNSPKS